MSAPPQAEAVPVVGRRLEFAVYGAATFANSMGYMIMVVVPLWAVSLNAAPLVVGMILGSRHFLVLIYSIHGGAMMDRLDARRVMVLFASAGVALPLLYPLNPPVWAVIGLQMAAGYCSAIGWIGAQAIIGQAMRGSAVHTGRMGAVIRIGSFIGPPLAGAAWDLGRAWAGFGLLSVWGLGLLASCLALPHQRDDGGPPPPIRGRDLLPRPSDYVTAFRLLAIPLVATVMMVAVLRIAGFGIQSSFYVVYLEIQGYSGTAIGVLLAIYSLFGGGASLMTGALEKRFSPVWLMITVVAGSIAAVTVTPLLGGYVALAIASAVNGACYSLSQPLMITLTSRAVGRDNQGKAVGLRTTANRLAATAMPVVMGLVVAATNLEASFFITGGTVLFILALVSLGARDAARQGRG